MGGSTITFIYANDLIGIYVDGLLIEQARVISPRRVAELLMDRHIVRIDDATADQAWLDSFGNILPNSLEYVKFA